MRSLFKYVVLTLLGVAVSVVGFAQEFKASAPSQVQVGQQFQVTWQLDGNGSGFVAPEITDFQVLMGPSQSSSTQIINGNMSRSLSYSYVIRASKEGSFTIGPAKIKVGGSIVSSNDLTINVVKGATQSNGSGGQSGTKAASTEDVFVRIEVSDHSPYIGEGIVADLKLYTRVNVVSLEDGKYPAFEGFWNKDITEQRNIPQRAEVVNGVQYNTAVLRSFVLYPQKSGEIEISPMELTLVVREQSRSRSMIDQFFRGFEHYRVEVKSKSEKIKVKPYPGGKPADFSGLTGKLNMSVSLDKQETKSNEAVNLKVTVSGDGNIYQLQPLDLEFPPDIEVYDPKTSDNIKVTSTGIAGSRTFEYVLIPRYAGEFKIGPFSFSYFNSRTGKFETIKKEAFDLIVEKGDGEERVAPSVNITNKEDIKLIGSDIRFIKQGQYPLLSGTSFFYRSVPFYAALFVPLLLFVLFFGYAQYQKAQGKDVGKLKSKRATGLAKKRLNKAKKLWDANETASFYEEVFKALSDYAADKFGIPVSALSKDRIKEVMVGKNIPQDTIDGFIGVLDKTEFARFAPGADNQMESVYDDALNAIVNVEDHA